MSQNLFRAFYPQYLKYAKGLTEAQRDGLTPEAYATNEVNLKLSKMPQVLKAERLAGMNR